METIYWVTKTGDRIDVDKMSVEHLRNTLKMIIRQTTRTNSNCPHNIEQAQSNDFQDNSEPYSEDYLWK